MSNELFVRCRACQSEHVLRGRLGSFHLDDAKFFTLALSRPEVPCDDVAFVCLHCGLVWSFMDRQELRKKVEAWGGEALKAQVHAWEEDPMQMLLRPAVGGEISSASELLRPTSAEDIVEETSAE